jgi:hypothetical protein
MATDPRELIRMVDATLKRVGVMSPPEFTEYCACALQSVRDEMRLALGDGGSDDLKDLCRWGGWSDIIDLIQGEKGMEDRHHKLVAAVMEAVPKYVTRQELLDALRAPVLKSKHEFMVACVRFIDAQGAETAQRVLDEARMQCQDHALSKC